MCRVYEVGKGGILLGVMGLLYNSLWADDVQGSVLFKINYRVQ